MGVRINIPDVRRDERIGSAFNDLFNVIHSTESAAGKVEWNFSSANFLHPFFVAPLAIFMETCGKEVSCMGFRPEIEGYFSAVRFGNSTKDRPEAENRGFGISKSREMVVDGLGGAFFMLSGTAFYRHDENGGKIVNIPEEYRWNGTIALIRIPLAAPDGFDYYKYVE